MIAGMNRIGWISVANPPRCSRRWMRRIPALRLIRAPCCASYPPYRLTFGRETARLQDEIRKESMV